MALKSVHLPVERHAAQAVQLAQEGERDRMVDEVIPGDAPAMKGEHVTVKTANDGNQIYGVLDGIGVGCGLLLDGIGTVGDRSSVGHRYQKSGCRQTLDFAISVIVCEKTPLISASAPGRPSSIP